MISVKPNTIKLGMPVSNFLILNQFHTQNICVYACMHACLHSGEWMVDKSKPKLYNCPTANQKIQPQGKAKALPSIIVLLI